MTCKYCGRDVKTAPGGKLVVQGNALCQAAPAKKHVILPEPGRCVYCGREVKTAPGGKLVVQGNAACPAAPRALHTLAD